MRVLAPLLLALTLVASVAAQETAQPTTDLALIDQKLAERDRLQQEIDELKQAAGIVDQVLLSFKIVEISLTNSGPLGFDPQTFTIGEKPLDVDAQNPHRLDPAAHRTVDPDAAAKTIATLKQANVARVVAEPSLVVAEGRPAHYFVGGEFSFPRLADDGKPSTEFKKFGTQIDALIKPLGNGKVRLEIHPTLSQLNPSLGTTINGQQVPGVQVQTASTACEVELAYTVVFASEKQTRIESERVIRSTDESKFEERTKTNIVQTFYLATPYRIAKIETVKKPAAATSAK